MNNFVLFLLVLANLTLNNNALASCLKDASDFAEKICGQIQTSGNHSLVETNGDLKIGVSGIVRKVLGNADSTINGKYLSESYENVLQKDLSKELFNIRDCRMKMAQVGESELCSKQINSQNKSGNNAEKNKIFRQKKIEPTTTINNVSNGKKSPVINIQESSDIITTINYK